MTRRLAFEPAARETYLTLRKDPQNPLYLAVRDLLAELLDNPGSRRLRRLRYRPDTWACRYGSATLAGSFCGGLPAVTRT